MQKVWRGERPQRGRFREFYQFDIDTVNLGELPLAAEAEVLTVFADVFSNLNFGKIKIAVSNRKILQGLLEAGDVPISLAVKVFTAIDKIRKIGVNKVADELSFLPAKSLDLLLEVALINCVPSELAKIAGKYQAISPNFERGIEELLLISDLLPRDLSSSFLIDFSIVRGLAYYTGVVFETFFEGREEFGSIASGGRYEDLASRFTDQKLPGCGGSIGLARLISLILENRLIDASRASVTHVVVTINDERGRKLANSIATIFRKSGFNTEVYLGAAKLSKQIEYAEAKSANWVVFLPEIDDLKEIAIKNLKTKEQRKIALDSLANWIEQQKLIK